MSSSSITAQPTRSSSARDLTNPAAKLHILRVKDRVVADGDGLERVVAVARADVDVELAVLEGAGALVPLLQVHSLAADDAGHARFAHEHALAHADGRGRCRRTVM